MQCPLCTKNSEALFREAYTDTSSGKEYKLYECSLCEAEYWLPLKNPGAAWYERDERYCGANSDPTILPNWNHRTTISFLKPLTGKVFDIGCGTGNFLAHAVKEGWEAWGIDFDRNAVNASRRVFGLPNVEVATLDEFYNTHKNDARKFDLVTFFDVFEHIDNHNTFIETVKHLLNEKGHIAMSMPYRGGAHWLQPNDVPPRHLTRWDRTSLATFLERHGFVIEYVTRVPADFFYIVMKFRFKYGKKLSFGLVRKVRDNNAVQTGKERGANMISSNAGGATGLKVTLVHILAKTKDIVLFGVPAGIVWLVLLVSKKRYTGLYVIACKR